MKCRSLINTSHSQVTYGITSPQLVTPQLSQCHRITQRDKYTGDIQQQPRLSDIMVDTIENMVNR